MNLYFIVSRIFEWQTRLVTKWPLLFIFMPLFLTVTIVVAAFYDLKLNETKQSLEMFLPDKMESLVHLHELMKLFPPKDALRDSYSLFGSKFAYVIYEDFSKEENIFNADQIDQIAMLHKIIVSNITTESGSKFSDVCFKEGLNLACTQHPILYALEESAQVFFTIRLLARYPMLQLRDNNSVAYSVDNSVVFGKVTFSNMTADKHGNSAIVKAKAIRLIYVLGNYDQSNQWIANFIATIGKLKYRFNEAVLHYTSSNSLADEMERNGELLIPWMPWMVAILILFVGLFALLLEIQSSHSLLLDWPPC